MNVGRTEISGMWRVDGPYSAPKTALIGYENYIIMVSSFSSVTLPYYLVVQPVVLVG